MMSEQEIVDCFLRENTRKDEQMGILAAVNGLRWEDIRAILIDNNVPETLIPPKPEYKGTSQIIAEALNLKLHEIHQSIDLLTDEACKIRAWLKVHEA